MDTNPLFTAALGLVLPWRVISTNFDSEGRRLDLRLDFDRGSRFPCPDCQQADCPVHDTVEKTWRHLDFFQHQAHLSARVPRITCASCGVRLVSVPWARSGSGFTLLMEAFILELARNMPVSAMARLLQTTDQRIWRVLRHYIDDAVDRMDAASVRRVGIDETSVRKRHDYVTLFFDLDQRRLLDVQDGRGRAVVPAFASFLQQHGGSPERIREASVDMSPAFIAGIQESLPKAKITFDRFHVMRILTDAVDAVRRHEWRRDKTIKGGRYLLLKNPERLTADQEIRLSDLIQRNAQLAEAYRLKESFRDLYCQESWDEARGFLKGWVTVAERSHLAPMKAAAQTVRRHWFGILRWQVSHITNGIMEGLNSLVQAAKRKARGYRDHRTFRLIAYLIAGKLDLAVPACR